ncbi:hypothetical protein HOLleu_45018 [Holothuria leucospilota]|uniref:Uncharacterized protein n=1 Tax=Holothuria leucospilota TaxID=206669 RepID=A0A9Q0YCN9_HOLLE|nr:hypothetical protein HOLleu_45018 [Holothuria leucospilota]
MFTYLHSMVFLSQKTFEDLQEICSYQCFITKWLMEEHLTMEAVYSHQAKLSFIPSKGTAELLKEVGHVSEPTASFICHIKIDF